MCALLRLRVRSDSHLVYDVNVAIDCGEVVCDDRGVANLEPLEQNDSQICCKLRVYLTPKPGYQIKPGETM